MIYLRPYKEADGERIISWIKDERTFYQWSGGQLGAYPPSPELLNQFKKNIENDDKVFQLTACDAEGPLGYLCVRFTDDTHKVVCFEYLIVDDRRRSSGLGRKILKRALVYAFQVLLVEKVSAFVFVDKSKTNLYYEDCGFREVPSGEPETVIFAGESFTRLELVTYSVEGAKTDSSKTAEFADEAAVQEVILTNSFRYAFQPIVDAKTGEIFGYEALMRAELDGPISPAVVLDYATKNNRLYDIEKATMFNVLKQVADNYDQFGSRKVFLNSIPGYMLNDADFKKLFDEYKSFLGQVVVELTEATELKDVEMYDLLRRSRQAGFGIAIDDYGTGYSNTTSLLRYLPDCVKIDRLLITNIHQDQKKQHFVKSLIEFAHENGFKTLAEGVETAAELNMVISLGVDLIQGFYTARPSFEVLNEIDSRIRNEIMSFNVRGQTEDTRKIYVVEDETDIPLMRVALEQYTGIFIAKSNVSLIGNPNYTAAMNIKIKDNTQCTLHIRDLALESFLDLPCIELGDHVELTLVVEGENSLKKVGICVPPTSELKVRGAGNLSIKVKGIESYGIGNTWNSGVGDITWETLGKLNLYVDAEGGIALGGGISQGKKGICISAGEVGVDLSSVRAIGVGYVKGSSPVTVKDSKLDIVMNVENGLGIGTYSEKGDVYVEDSGISIVSAGSFINGIGGREAGANIEVRNSDISVSMNSKEMCMIGSSAGEVCFKAEDSRIELKAEGSRMIGIGSKELLGSVYGKNCNIAMKIRSATHTAFGAAESNIIFEGGEQILNTNE